MPRRWRTGRRGRCDRFAEALVVKPLRGDVQQLEAAAADLVHGLADLVDGQGGIQPPGGNAARGEPIDLVFHQRDQRRDNQGEPIEHQRGKLVAERFTAAGGKYGRGRGAGEKIVDYRLLAGFERGELKAVAEKRFDVGGHGRLPFRGETMFALAGPRA